MTNHILDSCFKKHEFPPYLQHDGAINSFASIDDKADESQYKNNEKNE